MYMHEQLFFLFEKKFHVSGSKSNLFSDIEGELIGTQRMMKEKFAASINFMEIKLTFNC